MFLVICYAVHEKKLAGVYQFHSQDEAFACMEMDVKNTYDEEIANSGNSMDDIDFDRNCDRSCSRLLLDMGSC